MGLYLKTYETREVAGHNTAARKGAKNTVMYHQVLAFLPEECDVNGGGLTPELCMAYAKEYAQTRYPNQQIVFALHREHCKEDGIERYAVHMAINRTDLDTFKRLAEGAGAKAKRERAAAVRELDKRWGLQQVEEGVPNSRIHRQQLRGVEKEMLERGETPIKTALRDACHDMGLRLVANGGIPDPLRVISGGIPAHVRLTFDDLHALSAFDLRQLIVSKFKTVGEQPAVVSHDILNFLPIAFRKVLSYKGDRLIGVELRAAPNTVLAQDLPGFFDREARIKELAFSVLIEGLGTVVRVPVPHLQPAPFKLSRILTT